MKKIFKRSVWCLLSIFFAIMCVIGFVGNSVCKKNDSFVNGFLGIKNYEVIQSDEGEVFNKYVSDYLKEDGSFDDNAMRKNSLAVATQTATEGTVLLSNENNALPIKEKSKVSVFGISSSKYLLSAAGSGHLGVSVTDDIVSSFADNGLEVNPQLANVYKLLSSKYGNYLGQAGSTLNGVSIGDSCYVEYGINEAPWSQLGKTSLGEVASTFEDYGDSAIMIISRNDGEDGDTDYSTSECIDGCYLDLALEEMTILENLISLRDSGTFKSVVLVLNSASPMQMKHISQMRIDALVWAGVGGNVSFQQIAQVISGKANPSGHLIDTYAYDNYSAPSTVNQGDFTFKTTTGLPATQQYAHNEKYLMYSEGVYIGYRYYETRYEDLVLNSGEADSAAGSTSGDRWVYNNEVAYPFGYGKSYTTFEHSDFSVERKTGGYEVTQTIKNTGEVDGKDVFGVYLQKPYTQYDKDNAIEKPAVELVGYKKTKLLAPNESQTLTIKIDDESFKSYDSYNKKTYIVEKGDYYLASGDDVHQALNNILAAKGKTTADGMDKDGDASKAQRITLANDDFTTYSNAVGTNTRITNEFDDSDPKIYSGLKDSFQDFKYLTRSDWNNTYPKKAVIDCTSEKMIADMQYTKEVENDPTKTMPAFGKSGSKTLISMWGYEYDDPMWEDLLDQVTWEEAVTLATYGGGTAGCVSVSAPLAQAKDGPAGIGVGNPNLSNIMAFPSETNMASTYNDELIEELGNAFGMEILHVGYTGIYGPGANIHRSAFSGRNWEYYSEDPYISGKMLAAEVRGLQNRGIIVFTKHFLLNDQERNRYGVSVWGNEQSIREIYLKPFETGVREGQMNGIMSSFNRIGAIWSGKHKGLLTDVLRNEWGFVGVVQTDAYVGTHMHQALAESIVAGNDFTMGGSNPTALDSYKNNATLATALRETVHRILYTKLHSNVMNGLTLSTKIVYLTPWWETTLDILSITSLTLACISIVMFGISLALPPLDKRRRRLEESEAFKGKKVKFFFDVIPKTASVISSVILLCLISVSISVPLIVKNKNNISDTGNSSSSTPIAEVVCEHKCPTCGYCIDYTSELECCEKKCGSQYSKEMKFEAEDSHTLLTGGERGELGVSQETGSVEKYIGGFNANLGAKIKFVIDSSSVINASLFVSVSKREAAQLFTNNVLVMVNGVIMSSKGVVPAIKEGELNWVTFAKVCLGCVELKEGRNTIAFIVANDDVSCGFNFDGIFLKANEEIIWNEGEHICDDICPICGLCQNDHCKNEVCEDKCTCNLDKTKFDIKDGKAEVTGAQLSNNTAVFSKADDKVTFPLKAVDASSSILFLNIVSANSEGLINDLFTIKLNGTEIPYFNTSVKSSTSLIQYKSGKLNMKYGENKIEITSKTSASIVLSGITVGSNKVITYMNPYEFLTTSDFVIVEGEAYKSTENCIAMNEDAKGSIVTFPIESSALTTADLYINVATRSTPAKIKDILLIRLNGTEVQNDADLPNVGQDFFTYSDVLIGNITLKAGYNEITFEVLTNDQSINTNLRSISFANTDVALSFSSSGSTAKLTRVEAETAVLTTVSHGDNNFPYVGEGNSSTGEKYLGGINDAGLYGPGVGKITFTFTSDTATKAKLYFNAGISGSAKATSYGVKVNSSSYVSKQSWVGDGWYDWKDYYYSQIDIVKGDNTLEITILKGEPVNFDSFAIQADAEIIFH